MLKIVSENFIHALLLFCRSFSQNFPLGAPEAPAGYPYKIAIIEKNNRKRAGDDGKREKAGAWGLSSLFPLPIVPLELSFSFSPASPQHREASAEEREAAFTLGARARCPSTVLAGYWCEHTLFQVHKQEFEHSTWVQGRDLILEGKKVGIGSLCSTVRSLLLCSHC